MSRGADFSETHPITIEIIAQELSHTQRAGAPAKKSPAPMPPTYTEDDMDTIAANDAAHNEVQQLHDKYEAVLALRDAHRNNPEMWRQLDHEQKKAFRAYLFALQGVTMHSDVDSYTADQKLS